MKIKSIKNSDINNDPTKRLDAKHYIQPSGDELKSIWRKCTKLIEQKEFKMASELVETLMSEENISAMRICLDAIKDYEEMAESKKLLINKIESIIGKIK